MLKRCQSRGVHATGVFNSEMQHLKMPFRSSIFIETNEYKQFVQDSIGKIWIVGHCRYWTRGPPEFNENNHPVYLPNQEMMIVHNGSFMSFQFDKDNKKTDTFIPLWALEKDQTKIETREQMFDALEKTKVRVDGSYVFVLGTRDYLGFSRSLSSKYKPLVFFSRGKNVAFASTDDILGCKSKREIDEGSFMVFSKEKKKWSHRKWSFVSPEPENYHAPMIGDFQQYATEIRGDRVVEYHHSRLVRFQNKRSSKSSKELLDKLDVLSSDGEFTCYTCSASLSSEDVKEIRDGKVFYLCPNVSCKNHDVAGWRSMRSLHMKYEKKVSFLRKEEKKVKREPDCWFEDNDTFYCPRGMENLVMLDNFTDTGYCISKEKYVNKSEDCKECVKYVDVEVE